MPRLRNLTLIAALALPTAAHAQQVRLPPPDPAGTFAFVFENDTFSGNDRYYTNGFLFAWRSPSAYTPDWLAAITERQSLIFPAGGKCALGPRLRAEEVDAGGNRAAQPRSDRPAVCRVALRRDHRLLLHRARIRQPGTAARRGRAGGARRAGAEQHA